MTVFVQRASQAYAVRAQPYQLSGTLPAGLTSLVLTLTRESWPDGMVCVVSLIWPDGTAAPVEIFGGTLIRRDGSTALTSVFTWNAPPGGFASGTYTLSFQVLISASTALTLEGF